MFGRKLLTGQGQPRGRQLPSTTGTLDRVPCPNCGHPNDFRELEGQQLLDTGNRMTCDKCREVMIVTAIQRITLVQAKPFVPAPGTNGPTTLSPAQLQRLLR